jgi:hypothetical protein
MKKLMFSGLLLAGLFSFQSATTAKTSTNHSQKKVQYWKGSTCTYLNDNGLPTIGYICQHVAGVDCVTLTDCY